MEDTVTIPIGEYEDLLWASRFLSALQVAGVDNWQGYDEANILYNAMYPANPEDL